MPHKVTKENVEAIYPLTPMQEGMLFHVVSHPGSWHYFEQTEIYIRGRFDPARCEQAWNELVKRHEMLRSAFEYQSAAKSLHIILKESPVEFSFEDITSQQPSRQSACISAFKTDDRNRGFDLKHDSLLRFKLFQLSNDRFCLIWSHPHIILDGWSGSILQSEFLDIYHSLQTGTPIDLPSTFPLRYYWDWRERQDDEKAKQYWMNELDGFDSTTSIPSMNTTSTLYNAATLTFQLDEHQTEALQKLTSTLQTTINIIVQSIWAVCLRFHNNKDDVLFGIVVSGRPPSLQGIEGFVGLLINALPLRIRMTGDMTFDKLVQSVHKNSLERSEYEFISLPEIHALSPLKSRLFDHLFVFENYPSLSGSTPNESQIREDFTIESAETFEQSHYHFGIVIHPGNKLAFQFHYNKMHYSQVEMERLGKRLQTIIQSVLHNSNTSINELNWLGEPDRIFLDSLTQPKQIEIKKSIIDLWDEQLTKSAGRTAVISQNSLSYKNLDDRANRLASYLLHEFNIDAEDRIAVALPRDESVPVALLGIMKAGGCYLPIDGVPEQRVQGMLEDSQACAVIVTHETKKQIASITNIPIVDIDVCTSYPNGEVTVKPKTNQLAYMIYTSGSTGTPKGVLIEHGGFVAMIRQQIELFGIHETDTILQLASFSFDASLSEMFMALFSGATLVIAPDEVRKNASEFVQYIKQKAITVVTLSPSFLRVLDQQNLSPLRVMITAGEAAVRADALFYAERLQYFNAYGPTESSVCTTVYPVSPGTSYHNSIPIGKALDHLQVYVLGQDMRPMPAGVPGEICIRGSGVARGYHQRPQETERAFIHHSKLGRVYRTGDLGMWMDEGNLLFLGRLDNQIKIRGFRVELEEIEYALLQIPAIHQAAVLVYQKQNSTNELKGYYCSDGSIDGNCIRQLLVQRLPSYMIPNQLIALKSFPVNKNGKVDKQALLQRKDEGNEREIILPNTGHERLLMKALQETLSAGTISMRDSFQEVGGDSLLAVRIHARLRKEGVDLQVAELIEPVPLQTVATKINTLVKAVSSKEIKEAPCTPVQNWFFQHHKTQYGHFSHCVVLKSSQEFDVPIVNRAFQQLFKSHHALRTNFKFQNQTYLQLLRDEMEPFAVQAERIPQAYNDETFQEWCNQHSSFEIENELLFRVFDLQWDDCCFLVMIAHHLVVDAVSWQIILEDLNDSYVRGSSGKNRTIDMSDSYLDWSVSVNQLAEQSIIKQEKPYWDSVNYKIQNCGLDNVQRAHHYGDIKYKNISIPLTELSNLGNPGHQSFLNDISLTISCRMIQRLTQNDEIGLLLSNHGRHSLTTGMNVTGTVGWFTNYYPVIFHFETDDIQHQLNTVKSAIAAIPNHGMGYGLTYYHSVDSASGDRGSNFLFNFIGEIQSYQSKEPFQIDTTKTRSFIHRDVEFPFRLCIDVLFDKDHMIFELAYTDSVYLSEDILFHSIPVKKTS